MGASKRVAERIVLDLSRKNGTRFLVVRFGNVLGSSGSVIPRFQEQIRAGGPVTVTHPEVYRYFMLTAEAVQLVLHAATQSETGVLYVLEMGEPIRLLDMAHNVIRLSGYVPEDDIPIKIVGLRPGEKLSEDLVGRGETAEPSGIEGILRIQPSAVTDSTRLRDQVAKLEALAVQGDSDAAVAQLSMIVPTFEFQRGERRKRPPHYRIAQVRHALLRLARCQTVDDLQALLEEVRKDLGFQTFKVRFHPDTAPLALNGILDLEVRDPTPPRDPDLVRQNGVPSWTGRADILVERREPRAQRRDVRNGEAGEHGGRGAGETGTRSAESWSQPRTVNVEPRSPMDAHVLGAVLATKPAWKHRRASENDDELLHLLADALAQWLSRHASSTL